MKLYQAVTSPFAVRVRIAAYGKGVDLAVAPPPGGFASDAFKALTPMGKVPSLHLDDGRIIAESAVINEYLNDACDGPDLLPADPAERARARMITAMADAYVLARYLPLFALVKAEGQDSPALAAGLGEVRRGLAALERCVDGDGHAVGQSLTLADCGMAPALYYLTEYGEEYFGVADILADCPKLQALWRNLRQNPHVKRALADR